MEATGLATPQQQPHGPTQTKVTKLKWDVDNVWEGGTGKNVQSTGWGHRGGVRETGLARCGSNGLGNMGPRGGWALMPNA